MVTVLLFVVAGLTTWAAIGQGSGGALTLAAACGFTAAAVLRVTRFWWCGGSPR